MNKYKVQLFIPCFMDQLFPETAFNTLKVLEKFGCQVSYNTDQTCCGQPAFNSGYWNESYAVAKKFISEFSDFDYVVSPGGSCTGFIRNYYHQLFETNHDTIGVHRTKHFYELTEFLTEILKVADVGATFNGVASYHDACGSLRECGIREAPRKLLSHVKGLEIRETHDCEVCCGFGGTFSVKFEPISVGMAEQKVVNSVNKGAEYIISTDSSCLLQLDAYIRKHDIPVKTMHIADVLATGW